MHKASVVGTISERNHVLKDTSSSKEKKDTNGVWCKDCVVSCILDCDQHTFSIEVDGKLVKDAVVKNLPSGVKFFPLISTCPAPEEEEDENDDMDDNDAEILELKKKTKASFPLISIVREKKEVVETKEVSKKEEEEARLGRKRRNPQHHPRKSLDGNGRELTRRDGISLKKRL